MQYLLMIFDAEEKWAAMPPAERRALLGEFREFTQAIVRSGHFRGGAELQPTSTATVVRERNGRRIATDGPFAEAKEQVGGYYLVECGDLDEAITIAGRIPSVRVGAAIEVRPVMPPRQE
jgi:hypothetical protein